MVAQNRRGEGRLSHRTGVADGFPSGGQERVLLPECRAVVGMQELKKETPMQHRPWPSLFVLTACVALVALALCRQTAAQGRAQGERYTKQDVAQMIKRVETTNDAFTAAFAKGLDRSKLDGTSREAQLNKQVQQLERALDGLRAEFDRTDNWRETRHNVQQVMQQADEVDRVMRGARMAGGVEEKWADVRRDLNTLAGIYDLKTLDRGRN
jgi:hypothetical protein